MQKLFNLSLIIILLMTLLTSCTNKEAKSRAPVQNEIKTKPIQADIAQRVDKQLKPVISDEVKNADLSILVLGDSLAAGYGIGLEKSWVNLLKQHLEQQKKQAVAITNGSISGETTGGGLARLDELLILSQPDIVIVELGGNDGLRGYPIKSIRKNLTSIIEKSRSAGAKVMLCGIMIPPNYGERYANAFAELYPSLAKELDLPLVPFILDGVALNDAWMQTDGIHPNELGQPKILENVLKTLQTILKQ